MLIRTCIVFSLTCMFYLWPHFLELIVDAKFIVSLHAHFVHMFSWECTCINMLVKVCMSACCLFQETIMLTTVVVPTCLTSCLLRKALRAGEHLE